MTRWILFGEKEQYVKDFFSKIAIFLNEASSEASPASVSLKLLEIITWRSWCILGFSKEICITKISCFHQHWFSVLSLPEAFVFQILIIFFLHSCLQSTNRSLIFWVKIILDVVRDLPIGCFSHHWIFSEKRRTGKQEFPTKKALQIVGWIRNCRNSCTPVNADNLIKKLWQYLIQAEACNEVS